MIDLLKRIQKNAERYPDRPVFEGTSYLLEQNPTDILLWKSLWDYSGKLAEYIKKMSRGNQKMPIIVFGHKHPYMLVCFLACLRAGHA